MRIGIIGFGKMGREIKKLATERGHEVNLIIDVENRNDLNPLNLKKVDIVFEFTTPEAAPENIISCFNGGVAVVSGTTGWLDHFSIVADHCRQTNQAFFYASNYSIGVNILFSINRYLAGIMNRFPEYDVSIEEIHHLRKLDAPSGTAITLANEMIPLLDRKDRWETAGEHGEGVIPIRSVRENEVPGIHTVFYRSEFDMLEIRHSAKSRRGFAVGALMAATFLIGKNGVFGMQDLMPF
jgi:4-hydroxy-tetrahydrodipicolinate reductase